MRLALLVILIGVGFGTVGAVIVAEIGQSGSGHTVSENGVAVQVPPGWSRVRSAGAGPVIDPVTVLVVGTAGVVPRASACQVASYRVPSEGAVVVVVRWRTETSGGGQPPRSREPLQDMQLDRGGFDCWPGHLGGAADLAFDGHAYQVNVMIGDDAPKNRVEEALSVARSFDLAK
jgi:hypothetical protein